MPFLFLLGLNLTGLALAIPRYLYWDRGHAGTIWMNVFWAVFNVVILGVALSVCAEERQRRHAVRLVALCRWCCVHAGKPSRRNDRHVHQWTAAPRCHLAPG